MFTFLALIIGVISLAMLVAGGLSVARNPAKQENRWFFLLTLTLSIWVPFNFLASNLMKDQYIELLVQFDFATGIWVGWFLLQFVSIFLWSMRISTSISRFSRNPVTVVLSLVVNLLLMLGIFTGEVFQASIQDGKLLISEETFYWFYTLTLAIYILGGLINLLAGYTKSKAGERSVLSFILLGFGIAGVANILSNIVFPAVISTRELVIQLNTIGYAGILLLAICTFIAITSHRLFDIHLIVARTLAYILVLVSLALVYVAAVFGFSILFFDTGGISILQQFFYILLSIFLALSFQPIKKFFDKITNRLFYRDAYSTQELLDKLNSVLVSTIELDTLLSKSEKIIQDNLKAEFCFIDIRYKNQLRRAAYGLETSEKFDLSNEELYLSKTKSKTIVTDELEPEFQKLKNDLLDKKIAVLIQLKSASTTTKGSGYMIVGPKQSGSPYSRQDIKVMKIIADELVIAIQNALRFEEIQQFNITLQHKIEEATKELRRTNEKLKALDETKDEFISMASHQLRTPLTSVKGYVSMVLEGDAGRINANQRKLLEQAFTSSQRMVYLIADLLNVSRLKTGKFIIEAKPTNLAEVIEGEISQLTETAKARNLTLTYEKPKTFPVLMLDETKIRQVIMNFIDNAIYYTPAGGNIVVKLEDKPDTVEYTVTDDGIGVPKSEQHHLFNKFYRAGNAKKARPDGTGLGLFMAKKVVVSQGGAIIFRSQEGKGSTFGFTFAKAPLSPKNYKGPVAEGQGKSEKVAKA